MAILFNKQNAELMKVSVCVYLQKVILLIIIQLIAITVGGQNNCNLNINKSSYDDNLTKIFEEFPNFVINKYDTPSNGYIFLGVSSSLSIHYLTIIDNNATPIFIKQLKAPSYDFKVNGNGLITYFDEASDQFVIIDSAYNVVDSIKMQNEYITDYHDLQITSDDHIFLIGQELKLVGMDTVVDGGNPNATVIGLIIQELDENKDLIFQWDSWDHYKITDTYRSLLGQTIDYVHANSISIDSDGDLLVSACYMNEITKIDKISGDIVWRLGGKNNEFTFINDDVSFLLQHSVRLMPNGNITLFDNGDTQDRLYSRGIEYAIDEHNKTVELVQSFRHEPDISSPWKGNMQNLSNGNKLIGWGSNKAYNFLTEFDNNGQMLYDLSTKEGLESYRAFRFPWETNLFEANIDTVVFDTISYGESDIYTVTVKNNSDNNIELSSVSALDTIFSVLNDFPLTIESKGSTNLDVKFKPSAIGGCYEDILTINSDGLSELGLPQRIAIQVNLKGYMKDNTPPIISIFPQNNSTNISVSSSIIVKSNEPLRLIDNSNLTENDVYSIFKLKGDGINGDDIPFNATINQDMDEILIYPEYLENNTEYCLLIEAELEDLSDNRISAVTSCFYTNSSTDVWIFDESESIIYPNPSNGFYNISFKKNSVDKIELIDYSGKSLITHAVKRNEEVFEINISDNPKGIYFVIITYSKGAIKTYKIVYI